jgi:hypothetical protein
MAKTYYIGWISQAVRTSYLTAPQAPSNYKDPDKIENYKQEALHKMMMEARSVPIIATLASVRIEEAGVAEPVFSHASTRPGNVADHLLRWLIQDTTEIGLLYGFEAEILMEMAALEALADGELLLPYQLWHDTGYIKDPYKMLLRPDTRKYVSLPQLVKFLLGQDFNPIVFTDPREQIVLAKAIVARGQLPGHD